MESTHGDHDHRPFKGRLWEFVEIVRDAVKHSGKPLVPTFAAGRAQLITGLPGWMFRTKKVKPLPIFLDRPMAIVATNIYMRYRELLHEAMTKLISEWPLNEDLKTLRVCPAARPMSGGAAPALRPTAAAISSRIR